MGGELAEEREWADDRPLEWALAYDANHAGIGRLLGDLNRMAEEHPALWRGDRDPGSAWWLDAGDAANSVFSMARRDPTTGEVVVVAVNATPVPRQGYRLGVPSGGSWREVLNSDDHRYGGSGVVTGAAEADPTTPWQGQPCSILVTLPPLGASTWATDEREGSARILTA
jgi:1,4-alpha-glucan branching enzyme